MRRPSQHGVHRPSQHGVHRPGPLLVSAAVAAAVLAAACGPGAAGDPAARRSPGRATETAATSAPAPPGVPAVPGGERAGHPASGEPVTLAFGGDVHFEGVLAGRLARDPATAIGPIGEILRRADLAMVNLETAVTARGAPEPKTYNFRTTPAAFSALRSAGVDLVTMANNHGEDFGLIGLRDSLDAAAAARFPVVGIGLDRNQAFAPYRVTVKGQRLAFLGATQVLDGNLAARWTAGDGKPGLASAYDEPQLLAAVREARAGADTVVVYLHWGAERVGCPLERQRTLARALVDAGADVVVGSHAHILLGGGYLGGAFVDYGLGNFVFYASGSGLNTRSGVLTLTTRGHAVTAAQWTPATIVGGIPRTLAGAAADQGRASWESLRGCTGLATAAAAG